MFMDKTVTTRIHLCIRFSDIEASFWTIFLQ